MVERTHRKYPPNREPYSVRKCIEAIKAAVTIEDYLAAHDVRLSRNRARCIVHGGDNPQSFAVYPDQQRWYCFKCAQGGDLIDLCELVERHAERWTAVEALAMRFGVEPPGRPPRWHKWQDEKVAILNEMRRQLAKVYQRRFYRMFHDPGAHPEDDAALWVAMYKVAFLAATKRVFA